MPKGLGWWLMGFLLVASCKSTSKEPPAPSPLPASPTAAVTPLPSPVATQAKTQDPSPVKKPDDLTFQLAAKTPDQVEKILGKPTAIYRQQDHESWYYQRPSTGPDGSRIYPEVRFVDGQVRSVNHWDQAAMKDKLNTARLNDGVEPLAAERTRTLELDEFHKLAFGKSQDEVLNNLGQPDNKKVVGEREVWQYNGIVKLKDGPMTMTIEFEDDVARHVQGS